MRAWLLPLLWPALAPAAPLDLPDGRVDVIERVERVEDGFTEYELRFPSPLRSPFRVNDTVWAHLSVPRGKGPFPCILVLPVMAAPNIWIEQRFINRFRRDGFAVMWLEMPYQFQRRPHPSMPSGQVFLARTAPRLAFNFRQSVLDARRALRVLESRPEIDRKRIGLFGVSLGALVGSAAYSVDALPRFAVFLLGGADFPDLAANSSMTGPFIEQMGISVEELRRAWVGLDPLEYRKGNSGKKALLINVRSDRVIPRRSAERLREAFPDSRQEWLPLGHYTALLHLVWVPRRISRAFAEGL